MSRFADDETLEYIAKLERELAEVRKECEEQARLNGMGASREAALMAKLAAIDKVKVPEPAAWWNRKDLDVSFGPIRPMVQGEWRPFYGPELIDPLRRETVLRKQAERDALKKDAERYRWLRDKVQPDEYYEMGVILEEGGVDELDTAIDAAIEREPLP